MAEANLSKLLISMGIDFAQCPEFLVKGICYDSRSVQSGDLFFAVPGFKEDGTRYVVDALKTGALAAIVQNKNSLPLEIQSLCFEHPDVREAMALASASLYQNPSREMLCLGVTGTKGKTSTSFILDSILTIAKHKTALMGTVACRYPGYSLSARHTTMESPNLQKFLREARDHGVSAATLEVSSHALSLKRSLCLEFDGVMFTNLQEDHLDFYGNMESYFQAKVKLFTEYQSKLKGRPRGVTNVDCPFGKRLLREAQIPVKGFGLNDGDYRFENPQNSSSGITGAIVTPNGEKIPVHSSLVGLFNFYNILGAASLAHVLGIKSEYIAKGIAEMHGIPGRVERVSRAAPFDVFVDFAHMGAALENVLATLRPLCKGRLIVLFGAGGDKPPDRRVQLGTVAAKMADVTWVTSDNPRTEDPNKIIEAVVKAFKAEQDRSGRSSELFIESDRGTAIANAIRSAREGDIVCLAGKGHQTEQIIGKESFHFDDREEARKVLTALGIF